MTAYYPTMDEGAKVVTLQQASGPALITADLHGNLEDFERLRDLFLASEVRGEAPLWISVGDWVHGPAEQRRDVVDSVGRLLYDYDDETPAILDQLFELIDRFPGRVHSLCGNHEHAHLGGRRTRKFHDDEAAHLEARLSGAQVIELRRRFASWPVVIRLASCGVVVTHGAPYAATARELERVRFSGGDDARELLHAALNRYGFDNGEDLELLARLSEDGTPYRVLIHGHDRQEDGFARSGTAALLLCTSFGARRSAKTYAWLDLGRQYASVADLRDGIELRRLWPEPAV